MSIANAECAEPSQVDTFAKRMAEIIAAGSLNLMISIGHRTGLFDAMATLPPATSTEIAERARLNERYVREWLGAMTAGHIVEYSPEAAQYSLPAEHAALLTRSAVPLNFASSTQLISILGAAEDKIVDCFRQGGGISHESFPRFYEVIAEESAQTVVPALSDDILPLVAGLVARLEKGIDVLDVGCGSGLAVCRLAYEFPDSRFTGYDFSATAIAAAQVEAKRRRLTNVRFERRDITQLGRINQFDLVTAFETIHDEAHPDAVLVQIESVLRPGGTFLMQDILASSHLEQNCHHPLASYFYTISCMHSLAVSLANGGAGLGACWGRELAEQMLAEAGFTAIEVHKLPHDDRNYYYVAKKAK